MINADTLIDFAHEKHLTAQRMYRQVTTRDFRDAVLIASYKEKLELRELINKGDVKALRSRARAILTSDLDAKSMIELRQLGKLWSVKYWNTLHKDTLIERLRERIENVNKPSDLPSEHRNSSESDESPSS